MLSTIVVFLLDHFDAMLIVPAIVFIALAASLRLIYGYFYVVFSVIASFSLTLSALYVIIFSYPPGGEASLSEKLYHSILQIAILTPHVVILIILLIWTIARFIKSKPISPWALLFTFVVVGLGHFWARSVLSALL